MDLIDVVGINPEFIKISASAIIGGIMFKVIERFLNAKTFVDEHTALRAELRGELTIVRKDVEDLREEVDEWREKYFQQVQITNSLQAELLTLRHELDEYKHRLPELL